MAQNVDSKSQGQNINKNINPQTKNIGKIESIDLLPDPIGQGQINEKAMHDTNFDYIPRFVDRSIKLPVKKLSDEYNKVKDLIMMHIDYCKQEIDYNKVQYSKDHAEAAIFYLRNVLN
jgi:hypothetical protein